jgi:beta-glucosidase
MASHHLLLSHGMAVPVLRGNSSDAEIGITLNLTPAVPASPSDEDHDACRHFDGYFNRWFLDPVFGRHYPADMVADYGRLKRLPTGGMGTFVRTGDLEVIAARTDFIGINYYTRHVARSESITEEQNLRRTVNVAPENEWTDIGWEVYPAGLSEILTRVHLEYRPRKIYVTENGASYGTAPNGDGRIHDQARISYLRDHLTAARHCIEGGVPLAGYFAWSLLDNFEWAHGYDQRFGITWVDYETQQRTPKDSALWYQNVIRNNALGGTDLRAAGSDDRCALDGTGDLHSAK